MDELNDKLDDVKKEVRKKLIGYVTAAFGLVAGLAWNDAIKGLIEFLFPFGKSALIGKFVYAAAITLVVVVITIFLSRLLRKE